MNADKKRKLRNIALLVLIGLIGGTFAFQAFNQQVINDRLRENPAPVGARVHDYFHRETENKDVFVENFGQEPIMARIRLSEFMEYQERGETGWTQVLEGNRHDSRTWTIYKPEAGNINNRRDDSAAFTPFSTLTFGWERDNQDEPWYLPTFNHDSTDLTTAAAGDAQDYIERGATHPGLGTDNYWGENVSYPNGSNGITWLGSTEGTRTTKQNLRQERNPVTLQYWREELDEHEQIGNFWVMDQETGWAYWANTINPGQATSYLIDEARMEVAARAIQGSYYYAIHVDSQLINVSDERFTEEPSSGDLYQLLDRIRVGSDGNASPLFPAPLRDFTFGRMRQATRRIFTVGDETNSEEFRYLESRAGGNHLIIRNRAIPIDHWDELDEAINGWFERDLLPEFRDLVVPVAPSFELEEVRRYQHYMPPPQFGLRVNFDWSVITNLADFPEAARDITEEVPEIDGGIPRAFALSVADVNRLSVTGGRGFHNANDFSTYTLDNTLSLVPARGFTWWWMRTPSPDGRAWMANRGFIDNYRSITQLHGVLRGGARPAFIIHQ